MIVVALSWMLAIWLVWEQTVWSWEGGPQMVGFSLMHSGFGIPLVLGLWGGLVWVAAVAIYWLKTKTLGGRVTIFLVIAYALAWVTVAPSYGLWQRVFIDRFTLEAAVEFFLYDAAVGDLKTVKAFLQRGIDIEVQGDNGTALHGAAVAGRLEVIEFLISQGANVNAINAYGNSPLANALNARRNRSEVTELLAGYGGKVIRGTEEQHDRIIEEQVRREIEETDRGTHN